MQKPRYQAASWPPFRCSSFHSQSTHGRSWPGRSGASWISRSACDSGEPTPASRMVAAHRDAGVGGVADPPGRGRVRVRLPLRHLHVDAGDAFAFAAPVDGSLQFETSRRRGRLTRTPRRRSLRSARAPIAAAEPFRTSPPPPPPPNWPPTPPAPPAASPAPPRAGSAQAAVRRTEHRSVVALSPPRRPLS